MAKRFTDTNKYRKPFIRGLEGAYKLLWDYLYHDCDHAGIWIVDFEIAQIYIGADMPINKERALILFNNNEKRIIEIDNGCKWFIPSFIIFQYGELSENNRAHNSVIKILKTNNLYNDNKGLISSLQGGKDKDKELDKELDKDKEKPVSKFYCFSDDTYLNSIIEHLSHMHHNLTLEEIREDARVFVSEKMVSGDINKADYEYKSHFLNKLLKDIKTGDRNKRKVIKNITNEIKNPDGTDLAF